MVQSLIMKKLFLILFGLYFSVSFSQETILVLNKIDQNKFNLEDAKKIILAMEDIKGIISFIPDIGTLDLSMPYVQSSSLKKMISDTESKKILWKKLKEIILK